MSRRYETLGLEDRLNDIPHSWTANPQRAKKRGTYEDYNYLKNQWLHDNPCATSEEITRAFRAIANDLGI